MPASESELSLFLTVVENTWIHRRQKRREQGRQLRELPRAQPHESEHDTHQTAAEDDAEAQSTGAETRGQQDSESGTDVSMETTSMESPSKQEQGSPSPRPAQPFLFKCLLNVKAEDSDVLVEVHWVEGQNKDLMNQLCTCVKNSLFRQAAKPM